jgi:cysteine synthase A
MIDEIVPVSGAEAMRLSKALAAEEGIFVGVSAGATLAGAMEVAKKADKGSTILCMLPDTGERYLSTPLFEDIPEDMTTDEMDISKSTPGYRFDAPPPASPAKEEEEEVAAAPADAVKFLEETTHDKEFPVVLLALEWCEFCWSVRKMLAKYEIPYRAVDLDSVEYQQDNKGGNIRAAIREQTGLKTIPQIYIGGQHIGGATELFDACKDGSMQKLLEENAVPYNKDVGIDPYSFLPGWLHSR